MAKSRGGVWCIHCSSTEKVMIPPGVQIVKFAGGIWRLDHYRAWQKERQGERVGTGV